MRCPVTQERFVRDSRHAKKAISASRTTQRTIFVAFIVGMHAHPPNIGLMSERVRGIVLIGFCNWGLLASVYETRLANFHQG